jgi:hypothetical protein
MALVASKMISEDVAAGRRVGVSGSDEGGIDWLVSAAAADQQPDLAVLDFSPHDRADARDFDQTAVRSKYQAFDHLVDDPLRIIDCFLDHLPTSPLSWLASPIGLQQAAISYRPRKSGRWSSTT